MSRAWEQVEQLEQTVEKRVLFSGIGNGDRDGLNSEGPNLGPVRNLLKSQGRFAEVHLFVDEAMQAHAERLKAVVLKEGDARSVELHPLTSIQLEDLPDLYRQLQLATLEVLLPRQEPPEVWINLSSGLPALQTVWILLVFSKQFAAKLVHVRKPEDAKKYGGPVAEVEAPTDDFPRIAAAYSMRALAALQERQEQREPLRKQDLQAIARKEHGIVFESSAMADTIALLLTEALSEERIMLQGETGVGKEALALLIHRHSRRRDKPFRAINCGGISPQLLQSELFGHVPGAFTGSVGPKTGLVELADGGTLFLDEIDKASIDVFNSLLRFLAGGEYYRLGSTEKKKVNVRVISATSTDLGEAVAKGQFRTDIYHRLGGSHAIRVPPLRYRPEDVEILVYHFLEEASGMLKRELSCDRTFIDSLKSLPWEGNVRELKDTVLRSANALPKRAKVVTAKYARLPRILDRNHMTSVAIPEGFDLDRHLDRMEAAYQEEAMRRSDGNEAAAARLLGYRSNKMAKRKSRAKAKSAASKSKQKAD